MSAAADPSVASEASPSPRKVLALLDQAIGAAAPGADDRARLADVRHLPARAARTTPLPDDLPAVLRQRLELAGLDDLYTHQAEVRTAARDGRHVVVATGTASGKSLCYQLPIIERLLADEHATALYLTPTKALAQDQLTAFRSFRLPHVRAATYDGDTPQHEREAVRRSANVVLTNPDMLHVGILPSHRRWGDFLHRLAFVVVDECHVARGVFGAHVAAILRRLRRVCDRYATGAGTTRRRLAAEAPSSGPTFVLASATISNPGAHAANLIGEPVLAVTDDGSPRPPVTFGLWEPPVVDDASGARRSPLVETADLLAGLVGHDITTLAFVRSRNGAEVVAQIARRLLEPRALDGTVRAYRAGYLASERRQVEAGLADGTLRGVAATDALELGIDVGTLDAVVIGGWPGTAASLWQQAGRAGRRGREAIAVLVANDDPLDHYLLAHPDQLWGRPLEAAVADVTNPYVLRPHLRCAAWELPLEASEPHFAPADVADLVAEDVAEGLLRERGGRWFWSGRGSPAAGVGIRSAGGAPFTIVDADSGVIIGDVDEARAFRSVHAGAIYLHQGAAYRVQALDLADRVAAARTYEGDEYTRPRTDTDVTVVAVDEAVDWGPCRMHRGRVEVTSTVLGYERRRLGSEESLGVVPLDLPSQHLATQALWLTIPQVVLRDARLDPARVPGAAHAAEHAAIGLLPLFAMCDRWDIGGLSTAWHRDTGVATIFIYDGYPGGVGITERGFATGDAHLRTTLEAIQACPCVTGCPSCVQSPKCGNGNAPLDKDGAVRLLTAVLSAWNLPRLVGVEGVTEEVTWRQR